MATIKMNFLRIKLTKSRAVRTVQIVAAHRRE